MESPRTRNRPGLVSRARQLPETSLRTAFDALSPPRTVWGPPEGALVVAGGAAATIEATEGNRFREVASAIETLFDSGDVHAGTEAARPRVFGGFSFHGGDGDHREHDDGSTWDGYPDARFLLPSVQVTLTDRGAWLTVTEAGENARVEDVERRLDAEFDRLTETSQAASPPTPPGIAKRRRTTTPEEWSASIQSAIDRIERNELTKVVFAQALEVELEGKLDPGSTLDRLGSAYPDCYRFCFETPDGEAAFFGATPERLVSLHGRTVETGALAGTTGRGETPAEDEWLAQQLRTDPKNAHEHELVVEAIRDQLSPFSASISTGERRIKRLATVQHLWTPITAELVGDRGVLELVEALHPTPAVGGVPPERALETIRETEPFDRGWYAAPVGWVDAAGNGEFAVALRSALAAGSSATLFAGVGVVGDSDPDEEWDEAQLKFQPVLNVLEDADGSEEK
ncbi:Menaquinone-specific isochorismate synthase [Halalkaliarchaeum sp. AArc-CO]|uniref:isochorismate synthase n=1 Tax=unclassified Halalkaliarchaeum TaxID=2678344 RepID=UPI00217F0217|nr:MULTISPECIES: isochorismate synthase [unclassified Halalkaliarchaeum]MDR5671877.1 isochorismate synthase [Halalkaliarchaeum sp. AArc-GB]UWG51382.1 Menaquinone-specific isochorismate synthase [Halalkaliarchaeum sp. AArc-CO]